MDAILNIIIIIINSHSPFSAGCRYFQHVSTCLCCNSHSSHIIQFLNFVHLSSFFNSVGYHSCTYIVNLSPIIIAKWTAHCRFNHFTLSTMYIHYLTFLSNQTFAIYSNFQKLIRFLNALYSSQYMLRLF